MKKAISRKVLSVVISVALMVAFTIPALAAHDDYDLTAGKAAIDGKIAEFDALNAVYQDLNDEFNLANGKVADANKIFEDLNDMYNGLLGDYNTLKGEFDTLNGDYEMLKADYDKDNATYEQVVAAEAAASAARQAADTALAAAQAAYDDAQAALDAADAALTEALDALKAVNDILDEMTLLFHEINSDIADYEYAAMMENEEIDMANAQAWADYRSDMIAYARQMAGYLRDAAVEAARFARAMTEYNGKLDEYNNLMDEYNAAYAAWLPQNAAHQSWLAGKAAYDSLANMGFSSGSKLLQSNGTASVASYEPGNNSANGGPKINPNEGGVRLAEGLYVASLHGSDQWVIRVEETALNKEFIFWAHGNVAGEYIKVTFTATGDYNIGTSNGMNHLSLYESPGAEPANPEEPTLPTEPVKPSLNLPDCPARPGMPACIPGWEMFGELALPELGTPNRTGEMAQLSGLASLSELPGQRTQQERPNPPSPPDPKDPPEPPVVRNVATEETEVLGYLEIEEEYIPLAMYEDEDDVWKEEEFEITDEEAPLGQMPQTGVGSSQTLWILSLCSALLAGIMGIAIKLTKKSEA